MANASDQTVNQDSNPDPNKVLMHDWIAGLLQSIDHQEDEKTCRKIMKRCAVAHYNHLKMDDFLKPYEGELEKFNAFIAQEWGWMIEYQKEKGIVIADENKNYCVCPMVNRENGSRPPVLCFCSEGFAELMFSKVTGHPVKATVIASVLRGNPTCKYRIQIT